MEPLIVFFSVDFRKIGIETNTQEDWVSNERRNVRQRRMFYRMLGARKKIEVKIPAVAVIFTCVFESI